ncbi:hypothetical protein NDU88_007021 [Pleurodeles waltl]|uniref:Uncharacterized protein n=2 Tax=Pleurodeles waltl TaxID=8319 RepID=A0AAV7SRM7_PLEWA|nr:hypothetical protein NDU88_007021 [Pleurodeles waltl]
MKLSSVGTAAIFLGHLSLLVLAGRARGGQGRSSGEVQPRSERMPPLADPGRRRAQCVPRKTVASRVMEMSGEDGSGATDGSGGVSSSLPPYGEPERGAGPRQHLQRRPRSQSWRPVRHLRGHGRFNADTHSCAEIQSRVCQKPSDCDGCLGLYTCKLAVGKCDFKSLSRKTGTFYQSLQST